MRAIWSGMISFGLVNIPVKLYGAVEADTYDMNFLRKDDLCPIKFKKVCRNTGEEVPYQDIVRGYEYRDGDYIVLNKEDFEKAGAKKTYSIDIDAFVNENEVDPKYFEKPYFLEPDKKSQKSYALFRDAMTETKKVGIGKFVLKDREHLVMLRPEKKLISLILLRFAQVVRDPSDLKLPDNVNVPQNQRELAKELIAKLHKKFKPEDYKDTFIDNLKTIIEAKKKGKPVPAEVAKEEITAAEDIMEKLKESLSMAGKK